jgi:hypothetical protein
VAVSIADLFVTVGADVTGAITGLNSVGGVLNRTASGLSSVGEVAVGAVRSVGTVAASLATVGTVGLVGFGTASFFAAARASELNATLGALAKTSGIGVGTLNAAAAGIQSMGIETATARQITALFVQNQLDLAKSTGLARVAQDAAVISGQNSTDTLDGLVHGIVTLNTEVIRQAGLTVDIDQVERAYAKTLGISATALTTNQKQTAVLNAVLEQGKRIAGAYATAMEEPGKVLRSLPRVVNDLQIAFGERLLPEFGPLIIAFFNLVKTMGALAGEGQPLGIIFTAIGHAFASLTTPVLGAIEGFQEWLKALKPEDVQAIVGVIENMSAALGPLLGFILTIGAKALPIVGKLVAGFNPFAVAFVILAAQSSVVRDKLGQLLSTITGFLARADFSKWGEMVKQVFAGDFDVATQLLLLNLDDLFSGVGQLGPLFQKIFAGDIGGALDEFKSILNQAFPGAEGFFNVVGTLAEALGKFAGDLGAGLIDFFTVQLPPVLDAIGRFGGNVGEGLTTFFTVTLPPILDQIARFTGDVTAPLVQFFQEHVPVILDGAGKFAGDVGAGLVTFFTVDLPQIVAQAGTITPATFTPLVDFFQTQTPLVIAGLERFGGAPIQPFVDFFANFGEIQRQVQSLGPLFAAVREFADALNTLSITIFNLQGAAADKALGPLGDALKTFVDTAQPLQPAVSAIGSTIGTLGQVLQPVTDIFHGAANALLALNAALVEFSKAPALPTLNLPSIPGFGGQPQPANGGAQFFRQSFNPNGGGANGGTAVAVNFNAPISIDGAGSLEDFLNEVSARILAATRRSAPAIDNSGIPSLQPRFD